MYQNEGMEEGEEEIEEEGEEYEYGQELYGDEEQHAVNASDYGDEVHQNYSYQDPVQEVATEDEMTSEDGDEQKPRE